VNSSFLSHIGIFQSFPEIQLRRCGRFGNFRCVPPFPDLSDLDPGTILEPVDTKNNNLGLGTNLRPTNGSGGISTPVTLE
jgi:hypothetical protein